MKKITIILSVLIAIAINANAQIPNSGFENWTTVGSSMEPTSWYSFYSLIDSSGIYCPVTKSTDHYPVTVGNYSARITNDTALWNSGNILGWGMLLSTKSDDRPLFPVTGHPIKLCGYYKFLPQNGDTMNIYIHFYNSGVEITLGAFQSNVAASSWTSFEIFVDDTLYSSADSARISLAACNEPKDGHGGPLGNSVLYFDNLSLDNLITTGISESTVKKTSFNLYPNPATDIVTLKLDKTNTTDLTLNIYNIMGELVLSEVLNKNKQQINIGDLNNGIYMVEIKSKEWSEKQKLIIQK